MFSLFCPTWRGFENVCEIISDEESEFSRSLLQVRKTDDLEMFSDFESTLTCNSDFYLSAERLNARNSVSYKTLVVPTVRTF